MKARVHYMMVHKNGSNEVVNIYQFFLRSYCIRYNETLSCNKDILLSQKAADETTSIVFYPLQTYSEWWCLEN